uniref:Caveolin n=2 Tax=Nemorhina TaxID=44051 RepID=A0A1B0C0Y3_9MUSC
MVVVGGKYSDISYCNEHLLINDSIPQALSTYNQLADLKKNNFCQKKKLLIIVWKIATSMSDTGQERNSNSKSNLIEVQHVGVTAKLQSPLKNLMHTYCSSTETDNDRLLYNHNSNAKYNKFSNEKLNVETDSTSTDHSKVLYELKALRSETKLKKNQKLTPSKIEFQLYTKSNAKRMKKGKKNYMKKKKSQRKLFSNESKTKCHTESSTIFQRMRQSLDQLRINSKTHKPSIDKIFSDFPEPETVNPSNGHIHIGMYPFDHGCADYLKIHDCPPQVVSIHLAERAVFYTTRFWGEVFGSLHIGFALIVTFMLQTYRFFLYAFINTLLVGFLDMTSDYFVKPLLTVIFNGFLQPPLIFCFNLLSSVRDILEPIAETANNFMKPIATIGKSVRLIHVTYTKKNIMRNV